MHIMSTERWQMNRCLRPPNLCPIGNVHGKKHSYVHNIESMRMCRGDSAKIFVQRRFRRRVTYSAVKNSGVSDSQRFPHSSKRAVRASGWKTPERYELPLSKSLEWKSVNLPLISSLLVDEDSIIMSISQIAIQLTVDVHSFSLGNFEEASQKRPGVTQTPAPPPFQTRREA